VTKLPQTDGEHGFTSTLEKSGMLQRSDGKGEVERCLFGEDQPIPGRQNHETIFKNKALQTAADT
jgi:hypothetical protein